MIRAHRNKSVYLEDNHCLSDPDVCPRRGCCFGIYSQSLRVVVTEC